MTQPDSGEREVTKALQAMRQPDPDAELRALAEPPPVIVPLFLAQRILAALKENHPNLAAELRDRMPK